ncbi:MAG: VOC family protein [Alphaproteobacteria bacterium]|nr:VOC family protein [Alphaproteobacteria bacterium]
MRPRFHLAFPVRDLDSTRAFYVDVLGCGVGRSAPRWLDLDLAGHQLSAHVVDDHDAVAGRNAVDGDDVPVPHFGLILPWDAWQALADRLTAHGARFEIAPRVRFAGQVGEQATMFLRDPSGNCLEFKAFRDDTQVFAT